MEKVLAPQGEKSPVRVLGGNGYYRIREEKTEGERKGSVKGRGGDFRKREECG